MGPTTPISRNRSPRLDDPTLMFHLRLFGPVQLDRESFPLGRVRRKSIALLAYLANEPRPHSRSHLADLFWPDLDEAKGRRNLSWTLSNLRGQLPACLKIDPQSVHFLGHADLTIDTLKANHLYLEEGDPTRVLSLIQGEFMEGFVLRRLPEFEAWQLAQQQLWQNRRHYLLGRQVKELEAMGARNEALRYAEIWANAFPWDEEAQCAFLLCLASSGQTSRALKQFAQFEQFLRFELDTTPGPKIVTLYEQIREGRFPAPQDRSTQLGGGGVDSGTLPNFLTPFFGREALLAELEARIRAQRYRLISLVGAGGNGKTRLAAQVGQRLRGAFNDGVAFVSFADAQIRDGVKSGGEIVAAVIGEALSLNSSIKKGWSETLVDTWRGRHALLILDNFEHFSAYTPYLIELLQAAPRLSILVTSRQPLGSSLESIVQLEGLGLVRESETGEHSESVQLFIDRAGQSGIDLNLTEGRLATVDELCRYVMGSPLAIELLAPLFAAGEITDLSSMKSQVLDAAMGGESPESDSGLSMRSIYERSLALLSSDEERLFLACGVIQDPFDGETAAAVAGESFCRSGAARSLQNLARKSLLAREVSSDSEYFYRMHPLVRQFAEEKLNESPETRDGYRNGHGCHFMGRLSNLTSALQGPDEADHFAALKARRNDIFYAWAWSVEVGEIELLGAATHPLASLCDSLGWWRWGERALDVARRKVLERGARGQHALVVARLATRQALLLFRLGLYDRALDLVDGGLGLLEGFAESDGEPVDSDTMTEIEGERAFGEKTKGNIHFLTGQFVKAREWYERSLSRYRRLEQPVNVAQALSNLAIAIQNCPSEDEDDVRTDLSEKQMTLLRESLQLRRRAGDLGGIALALSNLANVSIRRKEYSSAQVYLGECLEIRRKMQNPAGEAAVLLNLSSCAYYLDDLEKAHRYASEGGVINRRLGNRSGICLAQSNLGYVSCRLGHYGIARHHLENALATACEMENDMRISRTLHFIVHAISRGRESYPPALIEQWALLLELESFVAHRSAISPRYLASAQEVMVDLAVRLSLDQQARAIARGQDATLDEAVETGLILLLLLGSRPSL